MTDKFKIALIKYGSTALAAFLTGVFSTSFINNSFNQDSQVNNIKIDGEYKDLSKDDVQKIVNSITQNNETNEEEKNKNQELEENNKLLTTKVSDLENELSTLRKLPNVDFKDIELIKDGNNININKDKSLAIIDQVPYYSEEFIQSIIDDDYNLNTDDGKFYIGNVAKEKVNLLDIAEPYDSDFCEVMYTDTFNMSGESYSNGIIMKRDYGGGEVKFNIKGKYNKLYFDIGHVDNTSYDEIKLTILVDEKPVKYIELNYNNSVQSYNVSLNKGKILKLEWGGGGAYSYGMANIKLL